MIYKNVQIPEKTTVGAAAVSLARSAVYCSKDGSKMGNIARAQDEIEPR